MRRPGIRLDRLLRRMLMYSDSRAANELLVWLGGSTSGGSARVNASLRTLGLTDTDMYGGYEPRSPAGRGRSARVILNFDAESQGVRVDGVIEQVLRQSR